MKKVRAIALVSIVALISALTMTAAASVPVISTGQTACYDTTGHLANCIASGQDGEHQVGVPLPDPRFTDHRDGTVTDNLTGLMWMKSAALTGAPVTWQAALDLATDLNANPDDYGRGGYFFNYRDWRLPNRNELKSLVDYRQSNPVLEATHPFMDVQGWYWTSTSADSGFRGGFDYAWGVSFADGSITMAAKAGRHHAWFVRAGNSNQTPQAMISTSPEAKNFGAAVVGGDALATPVKVFNIGDADLTIGTVALSGTHSIDFSLTNDTCSSSMVAAGGTCTFTLEFSPLSEGDKSAAIAIPSNDPDIPSAEISLTGIGGDSSAPAEVWTSGQTVCWDYVEDVLTVVPCTGTGQDGESTAGAAFPDQRFTDNGDGSVTDTLTGLVWLKSAACVDAVNWQGALDFVKDLNGNPTAYDCGGYNRVWRDWRLPNRKELLTLVDRSRSGALAQSNAALPAGHPFIGMLGEAYWTSTTQPGNPDATWQVNMYDGAVTPANKSAELRVWAVRVGNSEIINGPNLEILPPTWNFESVDVNDSSAAKTIELRNTGIENLTISSMALVGDNAAMFAVSSNTCAGVTLAPYEYCEFDVTFVPTEEGDHVATVDISSNDWNTALKQLDLLGTTYTQVTPSAVWKTGQTACYDASGHLTNCSETGQDGEIGFGTLWPDPRFTDNRDGTVTDHLTGLMWLKSANFPSAKLNWQAALDLAADLNTNPDNHGRGGYIANYRDWRLPNRKELLTLIDRSASSPALPSGHLFLDVSNASYWTGTSVANGDASDNAWGVSFSDGSVSHLGKYTEHFFLAVRQGRTTAPDIPVISVYPESIRFEATAAGSSSAARVFTVTNQGTADLIIGEITANGQYAARFAVSSNTCSSQTLAPAGTCTFDLTFSSDVEGVTTATLEINTNDPDIPVKTLPLFGATAPYDQPYAVPQTGQTLCFNAAGTLIDCPDTGQDGASTAGTALPDPRFIDNSDGTVTDNLTGFMWLKSALCTGSTLNWQAALDMVAGLNQDPATFTCGDYSKTYTDWRLPNRRELRSLVDYARSSPALSTGHPFSNVQNNYYWSSTTDATNFDNAWAVSLGDGSLSGSAKSGLNYFFPVRAGTLLPKTPAIQVTPESADFGVLLVGHISGQRRFVVTNTGPAPLAVNSIGTVGADAGMFSITRNRCSVVSLSPGAACTFDIKFKPISEGPKGALVVVASNDPLRPNVTLPLKGGTDARAVDGHVYSTGQTACYNTAGHLVDCTTNSGQDGGSMTGVAWPEPRFIDRQDGTVEDKLTGLIWHKSGGLTGEAMNWQAAFDLIKDLNANPDSYGRGGYFKNFADWRLPNRKELLSLIDYAQSSPALPVDAPFVDLTHTGYWSSTTAANSTTSAWSVSMADGSVSTSGKTAALHVLPVRSGITEATPQAVIFTSPETKNFGYTTQGDTSSPATVIVNNLGTADLAMGAITVTGPNAADFSIVGDGCSNLALFPGGFCYLEVVFAPAASGACSAAINIPSNDPDNPVWTLPLRGTTDALSPAKVWQTGQSACYDATGHLTGCLQSGQDGGGRYGIAWPAERFVDNGDGTVSDILTGLMWVKAFNLPDRTVTWGGALDFVTHLNLEKHLDDRRGGYTAKYRDWRLPNRKELMSLVDRSSSSPALPDGHPFTGVFNSNYWSATTVPTTTENAHDSAWAVSMGDGSISSVAKYTENHFVAVRAGLTNETTFPVAAVYPEVYRFPMTAVGATSTVKAFSLVNYGTAPLTVSTVTLAGNDSVEFALQENTCDGQELAVLGNCGFKVVFTPTGPGEKTAEVRINSNDPDIPVNVVSLSGKTDPEDFPGRMTQTGQQLCYTSGGAVTPCTGTGQDGAIQSGATEPDPRLSDNGNGTVTDNLTGLMWLQRGNCFASANWQAALDVVADLNANPETLTCGDYSEAYTDWRLPNRKELLSLVDRSQHSPAVASDGAIVSATVVATYWTSTTDAGNYDNAWTVALSTDGSVSSSAKTSAGGVWVVRGGLDAPVLEPGIALTPGSKDFGSAHVGHTSAYQVFSLTNNGTADLTVGTILVTAGDVADFAIGDDLCAGIILPPSGTCSFEAAFTPADAGTKAAVISVSSDDPRIPLLEVPISGYTDVHAPDGSLVQTGQTACWDTSGHLANCAESGQDGSTQTGIMPPGPRYIDHQDGTVTDRLTTLMWLKSGRMADTTLTWQAALDFAADLNSNPEIYGRGGYYKSYSDWRLPNRAELKSHILYSQSAPAITPGHPFMDLVNGNYWTSTTHAGSLSQATVVSTSDGSIGYSAKTSPNNVWLVRGGVVASTDNPVAYASPEKAGFGTVAIGENSPVRDFTVWNYGKSDLVVGQISLDGADSDQFTVGSDGCSGLTVMASDWCRFTVSFAPDTEGDKTVAIQIPSNDPADPVLTIPVTGTTYAKEFPVNVGATGQQRCYDTGGHLVNCDNSGQDAGEAASAAWPQPRFVDHGDGTVTDIFTGFMWLKCAQAFGTANWQGALDAVTDLNTNPGNYTCENYNRDYNDWKLPNRSELKSVVDYSQSSPALMVDHPFVDAGGSYWSATTVRNTGENDHDWAWGVSLNDGSVSQLSKYGSFYAWPMRVVTNGSPLVSTGKAEPETADVFELHGYVRPLDTATSYHFEYGQSDQYGSQTAVEDAGTGTTAVHARAELTGLTENTTYHYRLVASNSAGTVYGEEHTFATTHQSGALSVTITPPEIINAGARWRVDGGIWHESGYAIAGLTTGSHTLSYKAIPGWAKPAEETVTISTGQQTTTSGTYAVFSLPWDIEYSPSTLTNQDVVATITVNGGTVTSVGGDARTFTGNGSWTFTFEDAAGNIGTAVATVDWIDKTTPTATFAYSATDPTNQDVTVTLQPSEAVVVANNGSLTTRTFTENGSFTFEFADAAGNVGTATAAVWNIDKTAPTVSQITYSPATLTNQDVVATITLSDGTVTSAGGAAHTFSENGSWTFTYADTVGNAGSTVATVNWIDKVGPTATVAYSTTDPTNQDVTVTLQPSEAVTITNNGNSPTRTFTENGSFTFEFTDTAGNTGSATATVANIDKIPPSVSGIAYNPATLTNQDVVATITVNGGTVTSAGGAAHTFSENGSWSFAYADAAGNSGTATTTVDWIDKVVPTATVAYSITDPTNQDVTVTLQPSETVTVTNNGNLTTRTFTGNGSFTFEFADAAGNAGTATATVSNIDKTAPTVSGLTYSPATLTNQDVVATITLSDGTVTSAGGVTHTFSENGSWTYTYADTVGNTGTTVAAVNWIDKTAPTAALVYSTTDPTNQDVTVTLQPSEAVAVTNNGNLNTRTFTENGSFTFEFTDAAGNTGTAIATVANIDKTIPTVSDITYSPAILTNQNVVATITISDGTVTSSGGATHTFTENGSWTFMYEDALGNTGTAVATVHWIDKVAPTGNLEYSTAYPTNQDVVVTLQPYEPVTVTNNDGQLIYTFSENGSFLFELVDGAGNSGFALATVNNIDKSAPTVASIDYDPAVLTNQDVVATITLSDGTVTSAGGAAHTFTENGSWIFEFADALGNTGSAVATVDWIDKSIPTAIVDAPTGVVHTQTASITVNGTGLTHYKYKLDAGAYSSAIASSQAIELTGLSEGPHTLYVLGCGVTGSCQLETSPTIATWDVDIVIAGDINDDGSINLSDAILSLQASGRIETPAVKSAADVDGDGKIGLEETLYILQALLNLRF